MLDITFRTLRFFSPPPPSADLLAVLPRAFAAALGFFPALAGCVRDGHVGASAGIGAVVPLVLKAFELSVADVDTDVPGSALHDRLAPMDREGDIADGPALTLQATRFACSGIALGMRMAHALSDGVGAARTGHHHALPMDTAV